MQERLAPILEARFEQPATASEIDGIRERWCAAQNLAAGAAPPRPFLIVTPLGIPLRDRIGQLLADAHIPITGRTRISRWPCVSTFIYARTDDEERLRVALAFEHLWRAIILSEEAERWDLPSRDDLAHLIELKAQVHAVLGTVGIRLSLPGVIVRTHDRTVHLRVLHVPDLDTFEHESRLLDALV
jgi:hypothetical protein